jgi:methylated-DNA-[protein]-cysteine S-methyltransferase
MSPATTTTTLSRHAASIPSPVGDLLAVVDGRGRLLELRFASTKGAARDRAELERDHAGRGHALDWNAAKLRPVARELERYFAGRARTFTLEVAPEGTPFQERVWRELAKIPWGTTISYGELARRVGRPGAARAVGRANGTNPIPIVLPCHRVIGASGALTGYGGGMDRKQKLLALEGCLLL